MPRRSQKPAKTVSERPTPRVWFYDASAVAKAYLDEPESRAVRGWMSSGQVTISRLSLVEVASAIHRRFRDRQLSTGKRDAAIGALVADAEHWGVVELTDDVASRAIELSGKHGIAAGDAIQLASALFTRDEGGSDFGRFVAYDARLVAAARDEGLPLEDY